jgi:negative regulator of sigma E activity
MLADIAPDPVGVTARPWGMMVAGMALAAAVALAGVILIRRSSRKKPEAKP